ncbi:hypothetical protein IEQ34_011868 [Dendrobium chrysotoxum]|uniref:Uncharacterized protein n=1 Tax=Dendrobium chrysotoxum TaxID=161865 RepID=A0AAV7GTH8_DENCH|nr:hypothetical protein IEQ34_011868 [Dendrobium chrysotoxum]
MSKLEELRIERKQTWMDLELEWPEDHCRRAPSGSGSDLGLWRKLQDQNPLGGRSSGMDCKYLKVLQPLDFNPVSGLHILYDIDSSDPNMIDGQSVSQAAPCPSERKVPLSIFLLDGEYEIEFTILSIYALQLVSTPTEKYYKILREL